jgi:deoxyribose-phosphate aldolase
MVFLRRFVLPEKQGALSGKNADMEYSMKKEQLAAMIDHTLLKPNAVEGDIQKLCREAKEHHFWSVCVNSTWVAAVKQLLAGSSVKVCSVVGFPLGAMSTEAKQAETRFAVRDGADEIDMVINVGFLKSGKFDAVQEDIAAVKSACDGRVLKVIIETCLLDEEEKQRACRLAVQGGADYVKTSTGFSTGGAVESDVALMRKNIPPAMGLKASGGVRTYEDAVKMINAGATRIGTSNGITIIKDCGE